MTGIQWCDKVWNPVVGFKHCGHVAPNLLVGVEQRDVIVDSL